MSTSHPRGPQPRTSSRRSFRQRHPLLTLIVAVLCMGLLASACSSNKDATTTAGSSGTSTSSSSASTDANTAACGQPAKHLATTKALISYTAAVVLLKKYVVTPARQGAFKKEAPNRKSALVKAGATLLAVVVLVKKGNGYAAGSKHLCKFVPLLNKEDGRLTTAAAELRAGGGNVGANVNAATQESNQLSGLKQFSGLAAYVVPTNAKASDFARVA